MFKKKPANLNAIFSTARPSLKEKGWDRQKNQLLILYKKENVIN